ncbi:arginase family protein [Mesorhizobium sp. WSM4935]|uniref:arginase family protein n=1 Tax=Mesorhizobium sp. WSM4935 TaxID=3038547 RepID=UPI0024156841|nr:arginase family protein [Mesorhizobium sp. WSM4935]MDG4875115.1 arginase family protein [Mesorhizobium sp. WSM4935]
MKVSPSFLGLADRLADGRVPRAVIFGAGHGSTYPDQDSSGHALAAGAVRAASRDDAPLVEHWDFDLGGPLFEAARLYGSRFVTAREIHAHGVEAALQHIPEGASVVVTFDCDSLDPSIMPGVAARTPGGLTYTQVIDLIAGLGKRARIVGFDLVELYPPADIDGLSAITASRLLVNAIGAIIRQSG